MSAEDKNAMKGILTLVTYTAAVFFLFGIIWCNYSEESDVTEKPVILESAPVDMSQY